VVLNIAKLYIIIGVDAVLKTQQLQIGADFGGVGDGCFPLREDVIVVGDVEGAVQLAIAVRPQSVAPPALTKLMCTDSASQMAPGIS
jgi:hypothetical protein